MGRLGGRRSAQAASPTLRGPGPRAVPSGQQVAPQVSEWAVPSLQGRVLFLRPWGGAGDPYRFPESPLPRFSSTGLADSGKGGNS